MFSSIHYSNILRVLLEFKFTFESQSGMDGIGSDSTLNEGPFCLAPSCAKDDCSLVTN